MDILFKLFLNLRKAGLTHLYESDYRLLIDALAGGFGWYSREDLKQVCQILWVKSPEDEEIFDNCFNDTIPISITTVKTKKISVDQPNITPVTDIIKPELQNKENENKSIISSVKPKDENPIRLLEEKPELQQLNTEIKPENQPNLQEIKVVTAGQTPKQNLAEIPLKTPKSIKKGYIPPSIIQLQQSWHNLQILQREGVLKEIDIERTIENIKNQGIFFDISLRKHQKTPTELVLLFDYYGSMSPFHLYGRQLLKTASLGAKISNIKSYYFHNIPDDELYLNPDFTISISQLNFLYQLNSERTFVLIFSDGGAAKKGMNYQRVLKTQSFLNSLNEHCYSVVWVNPVPAEYWRKTTADRISKMVKMCEFNYQGWQQVLTV